MRHMIVGLALALTALSAHADERVSKSYPLQNHGTFELKMPASWKDSVDQPRDGLPPTITFAPKSGADFRVVVTPIWPARPDVKQPTPEELKGLARRFADKMAPQSVEKKLSVKELKGSANTAYYFTATDPAPKPDEYKILNQGVMGVGELRVTFTILTNDGQDDIVKAALAMLTAAQHH